MMVSEVPVEVYDMSNLEPADPTRTKSAMICGSQAHRSYRWKTFMPANATTHEMMQTMMMPTTTDMRPPDTAERIWPPMMLSIMP